MDRAGSAAPRPLPLFRAALNKTRRSHRQRTGNALRPDRLAAPPRILRQNRPEEAREIFIRSALVAQECDLKADFFAHNKKLINEITELEHKSRKQDVLVDDEALFAFYNERLPDFYTADAVSDGLHPANPQQPPPPRGGGLERDKTVAAQTNFSAAAANLFPNPLPQEGTEYRSFNGFRQSEIVHSNIPHTPRHIMTQPKLPNCSAAPSCTLKQAIIATAKNRMDTGRGQCRLLAKKRIGRGCIRLAAQNDRILGFIEYLPEQNHLTAYLPTPVHQRQGVASRCCRRFAAGGCR